MLPIIVKDAAPHWITGGPECAKINGKANALITIPVVKNIANSVAAELLAISSWNRFAITNGSGASM